MGHTRNKKGSIFLFVIVVIATFTVMFGIPILMAMNLKQESKATDFASGYDLNVGESRRGVLDKWRIDKHESSGMVSLMISNRSKKIEPIDYLTFMVYDTPDEARKMYNNLLGEFSQYANDQGDDWFTFWEPGVCDAEITAMYYLEENIIISADIEVISTWAEERVDQVNQPAKENYFDRSTLKDYIIDNADDLRIYILHDVLEAL